jgi:hypothetical protein
MKYAAVMAAILAISVASNVNAEGTTYSLGLEDVSVAAGSTGVVNVWLVATGSGASLNSFDFDVLLTDPSGKVKLTGASQTSYSPGNFTSTLYDLGSGAFDVYAGAADIDGTTSKLVSGKVAIAQIQYSVASDCAPGKWELSFDPDYTKLKVTNGAISSVTPALSVGSITVTAVPEPATLAMLLSGGAVLGLGIWQKRKKNALHQTAA